MMIASGGTRLSSLALGRGNAVVLLHGLVTGNMASWYFPIALPLARDRHVILFDQRGHGDSPVTPSGYDLDTQIADLAAVVAHHCGQPAAAAAPIDLVGHSMGALIALHYAVRHPRRVRRLVLVDAPLPASAFISPSLRAVTSKEALCQYLDRELPSATMSRGRRWQRTRQRWSQLFFASTLVADVLAMAAPGASALAALSVPTLLVFGRHSPCAGVGAYLARTLPQAQLVELDCGHQIPAEAPRALLAAIREFLAPP